MNTVFESPVVMPDIQSSVDTRHMAIQRVGVRGVRHPMLVETTDGEAQPTVGNWELTVALPASEKGTHMSRFVALLERYRRQPLTPAVFCRMAADMLPLLHADAGDISVRFPYFLEKTAPMSGVSSLMDYELGWKARASVDGQGRPAVAFTLEAQVPVTSLCPCSKAISDYGAHNQRSHVTAVVDYAPDAQIDADKLIRDIEHQASCELYGLLKRVDEKFVTERAYENPKFVEDLVRDVARVLQLTPGVQSYRVVAENFESIHNHSAYAVIEG